MPIVPRIQRLFRCKQLAELQRWHASHRSEPGVMQILADSIAMKHIEDTWPDKFKDEVRNLRLNIAMDGINPYSLQNTNYYVWPIVLININIPPWLFVKNEHLMLALIVSSRRQVKNMDVYLQPLIDKFM
jgi:predicted small metal-binding protein